MSAAKHLELTPDEIYLQDALRSGKAIKTEISMKALGKPDVGLQARVNHLDMTHVHRLGMSLENQGFLAPVVVFRDAQGKLWLADGHHRHECYRKAGKAAIPAYQIDGDRREALEFATMCNRENCLGRTREDQRKAAFMLFACDEWFCKSNSLIARHIGVAAETLSRWRHGYCVEHNVVPPEDRIDSKGRIACKPRKKGQIPNIRYRDGHGFRFQMNGQEYYAGSVKEAKEKAQALVNSEVRSISLTSIHTLKAFLRKRGFNVWTNGGPGSQFGNCIVCGDMVIVAGQCGTPGDYEVLVGRSVLCKQKYCSDGRMAIVSNSFFQCESLDIAKQLGIEFMTPDGLVESLKN